MVQPTARLTSQVRIYHNNIVFTYYNILCVSRQCSMNGWLKFKFKTGLVSITYRRGQLSPLLHAIV
jgi:hypothetical protein